MPSPVSDPAAQEAAAWHDFVVALGRQLATEWPAMPERLGDRYDGFIELAVQQALGLGLRRAPAVARYVNLCFVWGPSFHDKPGGEWAQPVLAGAPSGTRPDGLVTHQLVRHSLQALQQVQTAITPDALAGADGRLLDRFGNLGRHGAMREAEPPLPRAACDIEAFELRLIESSHQGYRLEQGEWLRVPIPQPGPLRVRAGQPLPRLVSVLAPEASEPGWPGLAMNVATASGPLAAGPAPVRVQARLAPAAVCSSDTHPVLGFAGPIGRQAWVGHETRAVSWELTARPAEPPPAGSGSLVAEETSPELYRLELEACGLRDDGTAMAPAQLLLGAWPATQWWIEVQRTEPMTQSLLPGGRPWQRAATRCRVERDGAARNAEPLRLQFEQGLDGAVAAGLHRLTQAWQAVPGLAAPHLQTQLGVLVGQARAAWGWWPGPEGLVGAPFMRVLADLALDGCLAELELGGELSLGAARARLTVTVSGRAPFQSPAAPVRPPGGPVCREAPEPLLLAAQARAVARWRYPYAVQLEPLAGAGGALLQRIGPAIPPTQAGAVPAAGLVGEAGLRPCTRGRSGWEWYAQVRLEPLSLPWGCTDPLLGVQRGVLPLLPALTLVDWSLG
jgi:hypothetical protein